MRVGSRVSFWCDPDYLDFVRQYDCIMCDAEGPSRILYLRPDGWDAPPMRAQSDAHAVPVCKECAQAWTRAQRKQSEFDLRAMVGRAVEAQSILLALWVEVKNPVDAASQ